MGAYGGKFQSMPMSISIDGWKEVWPRSLSWNTNRPRNKRGWLVQPTNPCYYTILWWSTVDWQDEGLLLLSSSFVWLFRFPFSMNQETMMMMMMMDTVSRATDSNSRDVRARKVIRKALLEEGFLWSVWFSFSPFNSTQESMESANKVLREMSSFLCCYACWAALNVGTDREALQSVSSRS